MSPCNAAERLKRHFIPNITTFPPQSQSVKEDTALVSATRQLLCLQNIWRQEHSIRLFDCTTAKGTACAADAVPRCLERTAIGLGLRRRCCCFVAPSTRLCRTPFTAQVRAGSVAVLWSCLNCNARTVVCMPPAARRLKPWSSSKLLLLRQPPFCTACTALQTTTAFCCPRLTFALVAGFREGWSKVGELLQGQTLT